MASCMIFERRKREGKTTRLVPVGVALWSDEWAGVKFADRPVEYLDDHDLPLIRLMESHIKAWMKEVKLPYGHGAGTPNDDTWWSHLKKLLIHNIRASSEPRAIDRPATPKDLSEFFGEVVGLKPERRKRERDRP